MKVYKSGEIGITLNGDFYPADSDGIIEIPDSLQNGAFTRGFVSAKGRYAELEIKRLEDAELAAIDALQTQKTTKSTATPVEKI